MNPFIKWLNFNINRLNNGGHLFCFLVVRRICCLYGSCKSNKYSHTDDSGFPKASISPASYSVLVLIVHGLQHPAQRFYCGQGILSRAVYIPSLERDFACYLNIMVADFVCKEKNTSQTRLKRHDCRRLQKYNNLSFFLSFSDE